MALLYRISSFLRNLFRGRKIDHDLNEEVRSFLDLLTETNIKRGKDPIEARRLALIELGGVEQIKEKVRATKMGNFIETTLQDLRYGIRVLAKSPVFTCVAVLTLALGIGANTAIFSVINGVLLRPLPYPNPDKLIRIWDDNPKSTFREAPLSPGAVTEYRKQSQSFEGIAAYFSTSTVMTGDFEPEEIPAASVSANLFSVMGLSPQLGRTFTNDETQRGQEMVVVLSHNLWQRRFASNAAIVGKTITLNHKSTYTIIGVMPPDFSYPSKTELWLPLVVADENRHDMRRYRIIGRTKPDVTFQQADAEIRMISDRLHKQFPKYNEDYVVGVASLHDSIVATIRPALLALFGAVGFVLLIACANVANLMLARAVWRQKEIAIRAALGAGRLRLIRQMLTESLLLSVIGGTFGLLLAGLCVKALVALNPPDLVRLNQIKVDGRVLAFTLVTSIVVGGLFGLVPALQTLRVDLNSAIKDAALRSVSGSGIFSRYGMRGLLVVIQTASAMILLAGAGLMVKSFNKLHQVELGFNPSNVATVSFSPAFSRLPDDQQMNQYYKQVIDSVKTIPGVTSVAAVTGSPLGGFYFSGPMAIAGRPAPADYQTQQAFFSVVSADYFRTISTPLRQGRYLTDEDRQGAPLVVVVNEAAVRKYFRDLNPIGQVVGFPGDLEKQYEIVGVVADIKQVGLEQATEPMVFFSMDQNEASYMSLVVRSTTDTVALIPLLRSRIWAVDKFAPITNAKSLDQIVYDSMGQPRFYTLLLMLFAGTAVILASIGLYGVMSYSVSQRTREIGIRMALGARGNDATRMLIRQGMTVVTIGIVMGLVGAWMLTRVMKSLLFNVSATDPLTFAGVAIILTAVALLACYIPSRRASRVDPMQALRCE